MSYSHLGVRCHVCVTVMWGSLRDMRVSSQHTMLRTAEIKNVIVPLWEQPKLCYFCTCTCICDMFQKGTIGPVRSKFEVQAQVSGLPQPQDRPARPPADSLCPTWSYPRGGSYRWVQHRLPLHHCSCIASPLKVKQTLAIYLAHCW